MAVRQLVTIPDLRLSRKTEALTPEDFTEDLQHLIEDMIETMYAVDGVGLAANQIGVGKQITVIDSRLQDSHPLVLINPTFEKRGEEVLMEEGCLSVPGVYEQVPRATKVVLRALDREAKPFELETEGRLAHIIQHEVDHLLGTVFIDYLSALKKQRARKKVEKFLRQRQ